MIKGFSFLLTRFGRLDDKNKDNNLAYFFSEFVALQSHFRTMFGSDFDWGFMFFCWLLLYTA